MTTIDSHVILVGAGVMSATLGMLLRQLDPNLKITMIEQLDGVAKECSDGWNNAGTGHAAYCELNYTSERPDGSLDTSKAFNINTAFETSLQFWSHLVTAGVIQKPSHFIHRTPHQSLVWGEKNVAFLRQRHQELSKHHLFAEMEYTEDRQRIQQWMPLVTQGRAAEQPLAATRVAHGSDVDFGALTRHLVEELTISGNFELKLMHRVEKIQQQSNGRWHLSARCLREDRQQTFDARFVFLGAGGGALPLLHKAGIPEGKGYGGFPVSGQWLVCTKPELVSQHHAKVYGKAPIGAPPMSVPHLDTRIINGEKALLFGPYAGFTTKFLKQGGSIFDLPGSVNFGNLKPMLLAGLHNFGLTHYLVKEALQSHDKRIAALRTFMPEVNRDDWHLSHAGQRVQIIKKDPIKGGKLEFGTEVIRSKDGTLAALLGASPGASTATQAMLGILESCFSKELQQPEWQDRLRQMFPAYGQSLMADAELLRRTRDYTLRTLELNES